ncbi:MAG: hypothetical protein ACKPKO_53220, partial [Candidatus Fonsibacter sp.]
MWHHTDYGQHCKLHYFWDQLIKKLTYLCVANSWGDRSRLRMTQVAISTWQAPLTTFVRTGEPETLAADLPNEPQSANAAKVTSRIIKEEAGVDVVVTHVTDPDLANAIYTIPEESEVELQMAS